MKLSAETKPDVSYDEVLVPEDVGTLGFKPSTFQ